MTLIQINKGDKNIRADVDFQKELEEIKKLREELGFRKMNNSDRFITSLIVRHNYWKKIKEDIIGYGSQQ